jgi:hypothetical protein
MPSCTHVDKCTDNVAHPQPDVWNGVMVDYIVARRGDVLLDTSKLGNKSVLILSHNVKFRTKNNVFFKWVVCGITMDYRNPDN